MRSAALIALLVVPMFSAGVARAEGGGAMSDAEVFDQVFRGGHAAPARQRIVLPVVVDGEPRGETLAEVASGDVTVVAVAPLVAALSQRLQADRLAPLRRRKGWIRAAELRRIGLQVAYDPSRVELAIAVPISMRHQQVHGGPGGLPEEAAHAVRPASLSGHVNLRAAQEAAWTTAGAAARAPTRLGVDGAVNVHDWVVEGSATADGPDTWRRGDVRLVRDLPARALRFTAGDQLAPAVGFRGGYPVLGLGAASDFSLQPYARTQPTGHFAFELERASEVTVVINGVAARTLKLPAGRHDVRDLALSAGVNRVELLIVDDLGAVRTISFTIAAAGEFLAAGVSQLALGGGFPLREDTGMRTYDWERPGAHAVYRRGLTDRLTAVGHAAGDRVVRIAGAQAVTAAALGTFGLGLSLSHAGEHEGRVGQAIALRYGFARAARGTALSTSLALSWERRTPDFATLGPILEARLYRDDMTASLSQVLGWRLFGAATVRHRIAHAGDATAQNAGVSLARAFAHGLHVAISAGATRKTGQPDAIEALASVRWVMPERRQVVLSSARARSGGDASAQASWSRQAPAAGGQLSTRATVGATRDARSAGAAADFTGQRMTASLSQDTVVTAGAPVQTTTATLGTALVFAGRQLAWSRPVDGSFAIVAPNEALRGHDVDINPTAGGAVTRSNRWGPGVVPSLQAYMVTPLTLDAPGLPVGLSLGEPIRWVLPTYRSGTLVRFGDEGTVSLRGTLVGEGGQPLALAAGIVTSLDDDRPDTMFFTNRTGRFAIDAMRPGRYAIQLSKSSEPIRFEIPAGMIGSHDTGVLRASRSPARGR